LEAWMSAVTLAWGEPDTRLLDVAWFNDAPPGHLDHEHDAP